MPSSDGNSSFDIVIAGAGIVGAACAWEFARSRLKVAIVETGGNWWRSHGCRHGSPCRDG